MAKMLSALHIWTARLNYRLILQPEYIPSGSELTMTLHSRLS